MGFVSQYRLQPILDSLRETKPQSQRIISRGPYRWVRHPLYLLSLFLIWSYPDLTTDRLLFNLLFTIWVVAGTLLEERDLTATFGQTYRSYQRKVPMFYPWRARPD
jgi:protein-S-isoprenylcysteine O-methyltransferase Ste14